MKIYPCSLKAGRSGILVVTTPRYYSLSRRSNHEQYAVPNGSSRSGENVDG
ncbi:hypothetical protein KCP73_12150 [Salmonella enterica subsp. enterica]|nr:hypothetical protein KCP73_12150 [Salmonella enterica subsp. enterica]